MFLMMLIWILVIAGLIYILSKSLSNGTFAFNKRSSFTAAEILKQRYARGEIQRDEFEAKKRDLAG